MGTPSGGHGARDAQGLRWRRRVTVLHHPQGPTPAAAAGTVPHSDCSATPGGGADPDALRARLQPVWTRGGRAPTCLLLTAVLCMVLVPHPAWPCACGCGVFEVGTPSLLPSGTGGQLWVEYDFQDQYRNWSGTTRAPASQNGDRRLRTNFVTVGAQYMFNRDWGAMLEVPYAQREFASVQGTGKVESFS